MQFLSKQIANLSEFRLELLHTTWCNNCSNLNQNELVNKDHWYVKSNEPVSLCYLILCTCSLYIQADCQTGSNILPHVRYLPSLIAQTKPSPPIVPHFNTTQEQFSKKKNNLDDMNLIRNDDPIPKPANMCFILINRVGSVVYIMSCIP